MNDELLRDTKAVADLKKQLATVESESKRDRQLREKNAAIRAIAKACMTLDRLQVELSDSTPYPIPDTEEIRKRILSTFDGLEKVEEFISNLYEDDEL